MRAAFWILWASCFFAFLLNGYLSWWHWSKVKRSSDQGNLGKCIGYAFWGYRWGLLATFVGGLAVITS